MHGTGAGKSDVGTAFGLAYAAGTTVILGNLRLGFPVWFVLLGRRFGASEG